MTKTKQADLKVIFENNSFTSVENILEATPLISINAPSIVLKNITASESVIP